MQYLNGILSITQLIDVSDIDAKHIFTNEWLISKLIAIQYASVFGM